MLSVDGRRDYYKIPGCAVGSYDIEMTQHQSAQSQQELFQQSFDTWIENHELVGNISTTTTTTTITTTTTTTGALNLTSIVLSLWSRAVLAQTGKHRFK